MQVIRVDINRTFVLKLRYNKTIVMPMKGKME